METSARPAYWWCVFAVDSFLRLIILCSDVAQHVRNFDRVQYYNNCMVCGERYKTV
jgi:hypothetical protein